jgi:hypothetical protein
MKAHWGNGGVVPRILYLIIRWRSVISFTPLPLYLRGKSPWIGSLVSARAAGRGGEEMKIPVRTENQILVAHPVVIQTCKVIITIIVIQLLN